MLHLPKCGGSSVREGVGQALNAVPNVDIPPGRHGVHKHMIWGGDWGSLPAHTLDVREKPSSDLVYVSAHVPYDPELAKDYHAVTMLRDPYVRTYSFYNYARMREVRLSPQALKLTFDEFIEAHATEPELSNAMAKLLAGYEMSQRGPTNVVTMLAEIHMHEMQLVGVLERANNFWRTLMPALDYRTRQIFGNKRALPFPTLLPHINMSGLVGSAQRAAVAFDAGTMQRIADANALDLALYATAKRIAP